MRDKNENEIKRRAATGNQDDHKAVARERSNGPRSTVAGDGENTSYITRSSMYVTTHLDDLHDSLQEEGDSPH